MVLTLTVFYEIPQLNVGSVFLLKSDEYLANTSTDDSEKARIQGGPSLGIVMPSSLGSSTTSAVPFGSYGNAIFLRICKHFRAFNVFLDC
jgi:hypothetical protein